MVLKIIPILKILQIVNSKVLYKCRVGRETVMSLKIGVGIIMFTYELAFNVVKLFGMHSRSIEIVERLYDCLYSILIKFKTIR